MSAFTHDFVGRIVPHDVGRFRYSVVFLPDELVDPLGLRQNARQRMRGEIDDYPFAGAWQPAGGRWFVMLNRKLLKLGNYQVGDWVNVRFRLESSDIVDVPEALTAFLKKSPKHRKIFEALSPGKKRNVAMYVAAVKSPAAIEKRIALIAEKMSQI